MTLTKTPIPTGLVINSQIPLDNKLYFLNEASLSNLGELDNFAFIYYKGMVAYCAQEDTSYKWKEIQEAEEGLLNNNFIYPDNWIKEGIDYSNKAYNFVAVTSGSETKINAGTNVTVTGNGTDATPYIINSSATGGQEVLEKIDEGNGLGIIIKGRVSANYGNVGLNAVDLSFSDEVSPTYGATGEKTFATGFQTLASFYAATASGFFTKARNFYANSSGQNTDASGEASNARNKSTIAAADFSDTSGLETEAIAGATASTTSGYRTKTRGSYSSANGDENEANSRAEFVAGTFGTILAGDPSFNIPTDRVFNIGVGIDNLNRKDGISIFKNGLATLPSVTNALITSGSGKAIVTKEYLKASNNLQKVITTSTVILDTDNNHTIFINNGATPITITIDSSITLPNFGVGFVQEGTGDVTFVGSGVSLTNPVGLKSKGQGYQTFIERKLATSTFYLLGNTKI